MLILDRSSIHGLLTLEGCIAAVECAFRLQGEGLTLPARRVHLESADGMFHVNIGGIAPSAQSGVLGIKTNGRFPPTAAGEGQRVGGALLIQDASSGAPLALLDSQLITVLRTAAVTAIVVRHLAAPGAG